MSLATNPLNPALRRNPVTLPPTLPTEGQEAVGSAIASLEPVDRADVLIDAGLGLPLLLDGPLLAPLDKLLFALVHSVITSLLSLVG